MRERVGELRRSLATTLGDACPAQDFSAIARQRGMFSMLKLPAGAAERLRKEYSIYITGDGRINIAGLRRNAIEYVAQSVAAVIAKA
jgi:aspartate/tyrosine/aromatic aminotransferase